MPTLGSVGQQIYDAMAPLAYADESLGYPLANYCQALGLQLQPIEDLAADSPDGDPGWSILLDVDRCPDADLAFLGQCVGVTLLSGATAHQSRARIVGTDGMKRGTPGAMIAAAQQALTGDQQVILRERYNPDDPDVDYPWHFLVQTYTSETPDTDYLTWCVMQQKPAGLIAHVSVVDGQTWEQIAADYGTWDDVATAYPTWADVTADTP